MNVVVHIEAELTPAAEWYEQEREGLGDALLAEANRAMATIAESPAVGPFVLGSKLVRHLLFTRFPYAAYFVVQNEQVVVMAFGHTSRRPGYWRLRLKK